MGATLLPVSSNLIFRNSNLEHKISTFTVTQTTKFTISGKLGEDGVMNWIPSKTDQCTCGSTWNKICTIWMKGAKWYGVC